jgi:hypothetical protein
MTNLTKWILYLVAIGLIGYDFVPFLLHDHGATISEVIAKWALKYLSVPLGFGVLMGHFFFIRDGSRPRPEILLPIAAAAIGLDVVTQVWDVGVLEGLWRYPWVWFLCGLPIGHFWWPQSKQDKLS